jgi:hypothetical protein
VAAVVRPAASYILLVSLLARSVRHRVCRRNKKEMYLYLMQQQQCCFFPSTAAGCVPRPVVSTLDWVIVLFTSFSFCLMLSQLQKCSERTRERGEIANAAITEGKLLTRFLHEQFFQPSPVFACSFKYIFLNET